MTRSKKVHAFILDVYDNPNWTSRVNLSVAKNHLRQIYGLGKNLSCHNRTGESFRHMRHGGHAYKRRLTQRGHQSDGTTNPINLPLWDPHPHQCLAAVFMGTPTAQSANKAHRRF